GRPAPLGSARQGQNAVLGWSFGHHISGPRLLRRCASRNDNPYRCHCEPTGRCSAPPEDRLREAISMLSCGASLAERQRVAHAPPVDADEQEQPDDIDEMPIPGRRLEAE